MNQDLKISISIEKKLSNIKKDEWDECANPNPNDYNPFISYDFLSALEKSKSINGNSGWYSSYFIATNKNNKLIGCVPSYLKNNSSGEYVFDYSWADAYQRIGRPYYPKLQISVPFTPVTSSKLLALNDSDKTKDALLNGIKEFCLLNSLSSSHLTFINKKEMELLKGKGWLIRTDQQFHWNNNNYHDFDDFLEALSSRKRKNIKKERKEFNEKVLKIETLTGNDIKEYHWDHFYDFYLDTSMRKWGHPYLERNFFSLIGETLSDKVLLIMVKKDNNYIAGALNFLGSNTIFGRNWGCIEHYKNLHFEVCYYKAIEYAITNKLSKVEAGAQGAHKISRGYIPSKTYSAHWIKDIDFSEAISNYLKDERKFIQNNIKQLNENIPFKG